MALVNHTKREINAKIVYCGPEGAGKGTSLRYVYERIKPSLRGELKILPTAGSSLLFFDFSPFEQPVFNGYRIRFHIYTLQGKVANPAAWKMMLKGTDGLVFVADASSETQAEAQRDLAQLREFLNLYGVSLNDIPMVLQVNKADLPGRATPAGIASALGLGECTACETTAAKGDGVLEVLTTLSRDVLQRIKEAGLIAPQQDEFGASAGEEDAARPSCADGRPETFAAEKPDAGYGADEMLPGTQADDAALRITVAKEGINSEGGMVRIPLDVAQAGGARRLVVTVTVGPG
jgi:signal recognition particle receptor subunit beta